jgi:tRNA1(Val) A37 N6-methylase TrmN6
VANEPGEVGDDHGAVLADSELSLDALTAGVSVYQRRKGHRFSSDDVVCAWMAMQVCSSPARVLDLGCGLGSVLLQLAWAVPSATLVGVEAQSLSFALLEKNVALSGFGDRVRVHHGDLRDPSVIAAVEGPFDLITGTPPYFPADAATDAMDRQRAYARIEYRGGVESYIETAAQVLARQGWFVVCGDADAAERVDNAATAHGLAVCGRCVVIPRAGRAPLFSAWTLRHRAFAVELVERELTLRDATGERTDDAKMLRAFSGFAEGLEVPAQAPIS